MTNPNNKREQPQKSEGAKFTWVKTHKRICDFLLNKQNQQKDLIAYLKQAGIDRFQDRSAPDQIIELEEIDPFTFFSYIYKHSDTNRLNYLKSIAKEMEIEELPVDTLGMPSSNAQKVWMFPYKYDRVNDEIERLWNLFRKAVKGEVDNDSFQDALKIKGIAKTKLTEGLFTVYPEKYLPINGPTRTYLRDHFGINPEFETFNEYESLLDKVRNASNSEFYEISYEAWEFTTEQSKDEFDPKEDTEEKFLSLIKSIGEDNVSLFFSDIDTLIKKYDLDSQDERIVLNVRDQKRLVLTIGQRYCLALNKKKSYWGYILPSGGFNGSHKDEGPYKGSDESPPHWYTSMDHSDLSTYFDSFCNAIDVELDRTNKSGFLKHKNPFLHKAVFDKQYRNNLYNKAFGTKPIDFTINGPLNIILFGPPGTGKTYHTIDKSVELIDGAKSGHKENKVRFDELRGTGQIEFITFHQNYAYEDFVVGMRPDPESDDLKFKSHKGIFYNICRRARENYESVKAGGTKSKSFDEAFQELIQPIQEGNEVEVKMKSGISYWITDVSERSIHFRKKNGSENHTLSISTLADIANGTREFTTSLATYYDPLIDMLQAKMNAGEGSVEFKKYVLIIDEINRANISRVFGELITLLEEDKRLGQDNEIKISLPNGEKDFGIPPNLFIIGTMNTADKSIALLDIALRRRFEFIGMYTDYSILPEHISSKLERLNKQITELKKSPDFMIGHAYFIKTSEEEFPRIMNNRVIPLLYEYFGGRGEFVKDLLIKSGIEVKQNPMSYAWEVK